MPQSPPRRCSQTGCKETGPGRWCAKHQQHNDDRERRRQYDRDRSGDPFREEYQSHRWARTREVVFNREPLCVDCGNHGSVVCDHKVPARLWVAQHGEDMDSFYDLANLQGMCKRCHDRKTALEDSNFTGRTRCGLDS